MSSYLSSSCWWWSFRPSVLQVWNYHQLKKDEIVEYYIRDNERAQKEGVTIPPHPSPFSSIQTQQPQQQSLGLDQEQDQQPCFLRTAQWNLQAWRSPRGDCTDIDGIHRTLFATDADVLILNEYHWGDRDSRYLYNGKVHSYFERQLTSHGYHHFYCGINITPTLIATKHPVLDYVEIRLSHERSALCLKLSLHSMAVWVIGAHLDHLDGDQRYNEMQMLLKKIDKHDNSGLLTQDDPKTTPIIIMGDFNQQRQQDYTPQEWELIEKSMDRRKACHNDGVAALLEKHNFCCVFDQLPNLESHHDHHHHNNNIQFRRCCNWEIPSLPPSTHWSGTTIDYSYSRNIPIHGVYISPAGYSDHRMTVCDWTLPATETTTTAKTNVETKTHSVMVVTLQRPLASEATTTSTTTTTTSTNDMELCTDSDDRIETTTTTTTTVVATEASVATWIADDTSWSSSCSASDTSMKESNHGLP
jgi:endonuclease/exonuclease/phosphatase family metal-dependent hydrolase